MATKKRVHRNATRTAAPHAAPLRHGTAPPTRDPDATWRSLTEESTGALPAAGPLAREIVNSVAPARTALDAETALCQWLGVARRHCPPDSSWDADTETLDALFSDVALAVSGTPDDASPAALATLRVLARLGPPHTGQVAAEGAQQLAAAGVEDPPWVARLGQEEAPGAWTTYDVSGYQRSIGLLLAEGRRHHVITVLIDYPLGGGVKDLSVNVGAKAERWRGNLVDSSRENGTIFEDLDVEAALDLLHPALDAPPCPWSPSQVLDVTRYLPLLTSRVRDLTARHAEVTSGS